MNEIEKRKMIIASASAIVSVFTVTAAAVTVVVLCTDTTRIEGCTI